MLSVQFLQTRHAYSRVAANLQGDGTDVVRGGIRVAIGLKKHEVVTLRHERKDDRRAHRVFCARSDVLKSKLVAERRVAGVQFFIGR